MTDYIKKSFVTYLNQIIRLLLIAGSNIIIARYLGPSGKGILALITNFYSITVMIGMFGIDEASVYFISSKKAKHSALFTNILCQTVIISVIATVIFLTNRSWFLSRPLKGITEHYYYIMIFLIPLFFLIQHTRTILLGHRAIYKYNIYIVLQMLFLFVGQLILIPHFGLWGGVLSIIVAGVISSVLGIVFLLKFGSPQTKINFGLLKKSYGFGIKSQLGLFFSYINRRLDIFIVNFFLNPSQVGIYSIAVAVAELPWYLPSSAATVLFPWVADKSKNESAKFTAYVLRNSIFITFVIGVVLALSGKIIITILFGKAFDKSVLLLYILLPGILCLGITRILGAHFQGSGRPELGTLMVAFSFVETVVLDVVLIPKVGIIGAAVASTIAYATSALIGIYIFIRLWPVNIFDTLFVKKDDFLKMRNFLNFLKRRNNE